MGVWSACLVLALAAAVLGGSPSYEAEDDAEVRGSPSSPGEEDAVHFVHQCSRSDPEVNACLAKQANHLAESFRRGLPELGVPEVEPVLIDELSVALGSGPDGYRATFREVEAFGVSNMTITAVRADLPSLQFQLSFLIPDIRVRAHFRSSGVLLVMPASGGGDYWGKYGGVRAKVYFRARPVPVEGRDFLSVDALKMDFSVQHIEMGVDNPTDTSAVIHAALNLMINAHAQELLAEMKPALRSKLTAVMRSFLDNLFARVPLDMWLRA